jgi:large repetitive protein
MKRFYTRGYWAGLALVVLGTSASCAWAGINYSTVILADTPLGYWRLGESDPSLPAADASGNGNDGTYNGGVTLGQPGAINGDPDSAVAFDGSTGYVDIPSTTGGVFDLASNFSLEAWVINNGVMGFSTGRIFANGVAGSRGFGWGILQSQAVRFTTYGIKDFDSSQTVVPMDGAWHYVAVTFDSTATATFYLDGQLTDSITDDQARPARSSEFDLWIGDNPSGPKNTFNGSIDEAAIYNYVLTAAQVANHYAIGIQ